MTNPTHAAIWSAVGASRALVAACAAERERFAALSPSWEMALDIATQRADFREEAARWRHLRATGRAST